MMETLLLGLVTVALLVYLVYALLRPEKFLLVSKGRTSMTANGWFQICFFFTLILVCAKPLGLYMARVFERERTFADRIFRPVERLIYRLTGIDETHEMRWTEYANQVPFKCPTPFWDE